MVPGVIPEVLKHPGVNVDGKKDNAEAGKTPVVQPCPQHELRHGHVDFVGLGRMVLSYPELPADTLAGRPLARKRICRTFSDCTTAPRNGLVSGCYPLDTYYKRRPEHRALEAAKKRDRELR